MKENGRVSGHFRIWWLVPLWLPGACAPTPSRSPAAEGANASAILLQAHNRERAAVRVRPLAWDPGLAAGAAGYARQLALNGRLRHSLRAVRAGQGENLWMGTRGGYPVQRMVGSWSAEKAYFRPGVFPAVSRTGDWTAVGHYTQMIWPTTTRVGCAIASSARFDVLVCRYAPAGNIDGRRVP